MPMFQGKATTVTEYLAGLTPERRAALSAVRKVVKANLPKGYKEEMTWGAITWVVPLSVYPTTYNGQPLGYVALASKKNYASLYLMAAYGNSKATQRLREGFNQAGKKLDMGKACIRFKEAADLPLDVIGEIVAGTPMKNYVALAERIRTRAPRKKAKA